MKKMEITFKLNGVPRSLMVEPNDILLDVLRNKLGIKSPKSGCERGDCGTCTVFLNGKTVRGCLVLAVEADGGEIETLEGISGSGPSKLQKELAKRNAFQCGFCAPGAILSATELLRKQKKPSREEIKEAIAGNLCRCTGYTPVIDAVEAAAKPSAKRK